MDAARKPVRSELLASQLAPCRGALREIMVGDDHARLARSLRDCVAFSTASRADHCEDARLVCTEEGIDFPCVGRGRLGSRASTAFLSGAHASLIRFNASSSTACFGRLACSKLLV